MQWRKVTEPDVLDSGDEAQRSGDDSELEADGGLRCCLAQSQSLGNGDDKTAKVGMQEGSGEREGGGDESGGSKAIGTRKAKLPWVSAMVPPSNMKVLYTSRSAGGAQERLWIFPDTQGLFCWFITLTWQRREGDVLTIY